MVSPPPRSLGARLRRLRLERGLGAGTLADMAETSKRSILDWESDRYLPAGRTFERLLAALQVPASERAGWLAEAAPAYARTRLAHTPLGAPVHVGQVLRAIRRRGEWTQTEVARAVGVSQGTLAKWESGEAKPSEGSLEAVLRVLDASEEESGAAMATRYGGTTPIKDLAERIRQTSFDLPVSLREPILLGCEAELWWRAKREPTAEALLAQLVAARAQQSLLSGALDEIEGLARRAIRIARETGSPELAASAVYAACWTIQRRPGGAERAARVLGRWADAAQGAEVRNWLRAAQGLALTRAGATPEGIGLLEELERGATDRGWRDLVYHRIDLAEGHLLADQPEPALGILLSMGADAPCSTLAKAYLALGHEPPATTLTEVRARASQDWLCAQDAIQIERGLTGVRRGSRARFR